MADFNTFGTSFASFIAGGTISKNRAVCMDGTNANQVVACSAITDIAIGIATEDATSGYQVTVQLFGKAKVVASAAVNSGAQVMPTASGGGKVSTAAGATAKSLGVAVSTCANDGELVEVLLATPNVNGPANS